MSSTGHIQKLKLSAETKEQLALMGAQSFPERRGSEERLVAELEKQGLTPSRKMLAAELELGGLEVVVDGERLIISGVLYCIETGAKFLTSSEGQTLAPWATADSDSMYHLDQAGRVYYSDNIAVGTPFPQASDASVFLERLVLCPPFEFPLARTVEAAGERLSQRLGLERIDAASDQYGAIYGSRELRVLENITWSDSEGKPASQTWVFGSSSRRTEVLEAIEGLGLTQISNFGY